MCVCVCVNRCISFNYQCCVCEGVVSGHYVLQCHFNLCSSYKGEGSDERKWEELRSGRGAYSLVGLYGVGHLHENRLAINNLQFSGGEETARLNILLILSYLIYLCSSGFLFDNDLISLGNEPFL